MAELEVELDALRARSENMRAWARESYDRVVAQKAELIREIDKWMSTADDLGYELLGAEYGWENAPRRTCGTHVQGALDGDRTDIDLRTESVLLAGALTYSDQAAELYDPIRDDWYRGNKIIVVVNAGQQVLLVLPADEMKSSSLGWASREPIQSYSRSLGNTPGRPIWTGERGVVFEACSEFDTQFDGGMLVAGAHCVPLDIYTRGEPKPQRVFIPFGVLECP